MDDPLELDQSPHPDAQAPDDTGPAILLALAALTRASDDLRAAIQQMSAPTAPAYALAPESDGRRADALPVSRGFGDDLPAAPTAPAYALAPEGDGRRANALPVSRGFGDDLPATPTAPAYALAPEGDGRRADALPVFPRFGDDLPTTPTAPTQRVLAPEGPAPVFNITINITAANDNPQAVAAAAENGVMAAARRLGLA